MENQNRAGKVLLLLAGFALVLCVGMAIGGVLVFGVMRIGDQRLSRAEPECQELQLKELYREQIAPAFAPGAVIVEVVPGTPAEDAGLQEGDIIVAVDSQRVGPDGNLARLISQYEPGDRLTLTVRSGDKEPHKVRVKLGESPDDPGAPYLGVRYQSALPEGMPLREMLPLDEHGEWRLDEPPMPLPGNPGRIRYRGHLGDGGQPGGAGRSTGGRSDSCPSTAGQLAALGRSVMPSPGAHRALGSPWVLFAPATTARSSSRSGWESIQTGQAVPIWA